MPVYEYECTHCHHHCDKMQKISDPIMKQCPECSNNTLVKLMSATSFQLKGTGWYATDFKNKKGSTAADKKEDSSGGTDAASPKEGSGKTSEASTPKEAASKSTTSDSSD